MHAARLAAERSVNRLQKAAPVGADTPAPGPRSETEVPTMNDKPRGYAQFPVLEMPGNAVRRDFTLDE